MKRKWVDLRNILQIKLTELGNRYIGVRWSYRPKEKEKKISKTIAGASDFYN